MSEPNTCPTCGAPLAADAPGGACPKCLLAAGFATGGDAAADRVPAPEELAPHFPGLVIERVLGRGGMGVVYKARHRALDRDVALKVLPASVAGDPAFAERFQREARALARLQHPNIVAVHDFGQTDGLFWLVMEFVDGANIRQAMKAGQVGAKEALAIVPQICDALQYAHEHGVVHRDIKPENVLLDKAGRVKVADFGLAKMMEHGATDRTLTGAGQVMGTPHYMAPEQWERPKDVDHRADIYSLGVVFYEMLTGELPIGRFAPPSSKSQIDARIDEIVLRTLEKEREARYQRAEEVKTDVGRVADGRDVPPPPVRGAVARVVRWRWDSAEEKARGGRLSRLAVAGVLAAPLVVVLLVTSLVLGHSVPDDEPSASSFLAFTALPIAALVVFLAGWIASVVAWVRIQNSGDRLRGRAWAAAGTFLPVVLCCLGGPLYFFVTGRVAPPDRVMARPEVPAPQPAAVPDSTTIPADSEDGTRVVLDVAECSRIRKLWQWAGRLHEPQDRNEMLSQVSDLYSGADLARLYAMPVERCVTEAHAGSLGLPLLPKNTLENPALAEYRLIHLRVNADHLRGVLTATDGRRSIRVPLTASLGNGKAPTWFFGVGQVQVQQGSFTLPPAVGPSKADTADQLRRVLDFWNSYRRSPPTEDLDERLARYAPAERKRLQAMPAEDRERSARALQLGLALAPADRLPSEIRLPNSPSLMSGEEVHPHLGPVTRIRLEVPADGRRVRFWLVTGIVGDEKSVYFDAAPVEIE